MYQTELYHHGIKGQKWGIRRYQNPDGTLTEEGKRRLAQYREKEFGKLDKRFDKRISKAKQKHEEEPENEYKRQKYEDLKYDKSVEQNYLRNMSFNDMQKEKKEVGKAWVKNAVASAGGSLALNTVMPFIGGGTGWVYASIPRNSMVKKRYRFEESGATRRTKY